MADIVQIRRDTAGQWTSANPILANGEQGYETDTSKMKIGDGATAWTLLSYFADAAGTTLPVVDTQTIIKGSVDATKLMRFDVSGVTHDTTRVLTVPDANTTICDSADLTTHTGGANPHSGSAASGANSDITSLAGLSTDLSIGQGGTGQNTAQTAINALSQVIGATNEHVLTKDTNTGNAKWKVSGGGGGSDLSALLGNIIKSNPPAGNYSEICNIYYDNDTGSPIFDVETCGLIIVSTPPAGNYTRITNMYYNIITGQPEFEIGSSTGIVSSNPPAGDYTRFTNMYFNEDTGLPEFEVEA